VRNIIKLRYIGDSPFVPREEKYYEIK